MDTHGLEADCDEKKWSERLYRLWIIVIQTSFSIQRQNHDHNHISA
jgi:hypothetical protein